MIYRITAVLIAAVVLIGGVATVATSASAGGDTTAVQSAKKKKKKKKKKKAPAPTPTQIAVGTYSGTTSNGIPMSITLNADRASGTMSYCGLIAPLSVSGTGFQVNYIEPVTNDTISAAGFFTASNKQATGTINGTGCDATTQTFTLQAP